MSEAAHQRVMERNPRTTVLFEIGPIDPQARWLDYVSYGFDDGYAPDLLQLICDKSLRSGRASTNETWVPIHSWRTLGQLRCAAAVSTLIVLFDHSPYFDWALKDLARVLGMIGEPAVDLLSVYIKERRRPDFARAIAFDGLVEVVRIHPGCRKHVLTCFKQYMSSPDAQSKSLNGYLVCRLLDLGAVELVDDVRRLFLTGAVDSTCADGIESAEFELALRAGEFVDPRRDPGVYSYVARKAGGGEELLSTIDGFLGRYGNGKSVSNCSELDGFFAALACAPALIRSARWMSAIWGGKDRLPRWQNDDRQRFERAAQGLNTAVMSSIEKGGYQPLFLQFATAGAYGIFIRQWCGGFLRGQELWGLMGQTDRSQVDGLLAPVRLFGTDEGRMKLRSMDRAAIAAEQASIAPAVCELARHFREHRKKLYDDFAKNSVEAGRDEPCPCGSGRLYKNCCLRS